MKSDRRLILTDSHRSCGQARDIVGRSHGMYGMGRRQIVARGPRIADTAWKPSKSDYASHIEEFYHYRRVINGILDVVGTIPWSPIFRECKIPRIFYESRL
jgi:hypothetical protein